MIVLSHYQACILLKAHDTLTCEVSPDLGLTSVAVTINSDGVCFPDETTLAWADIETIATSDNGCFYVTADGIEKIQAFSEMTGRVYTLYPTELAPTMLVSGFPMHRIKNTNPHKDTLSKIRTIKPVMGKVLDCNTGLGYTATQAAKTAEHVITIELDTAALEVCRLNPWSQALFIDPKITQIIGDSYNIVQEFEDGVFSRIIHDPPTFKLAGDLYSEAFYAELYRILEYKGRLFHYIGDLTSHHGKRVSRGALQRLQKVGFKRITPRNDAFGVVAIK